MVERFFEDFEVGQVFRSGAARVTADEIKAFAAKYDPQPFHLDEAAASASFFGGLVASGWMTASLTMRLIVQSDIHPSGGTIGAGVEELRWPTAVRPGDVLQVEVEIVEVRSSRSRPDIGIVKTRTTTRNQNGEIVQLGRPTLVVRTRATAGS